MNLAQIRQSYPSITSEEVFRILELVTGLTKSQLLTQHYTLTKTQIKRIENINRRLSESEPLDYILGYKDFYKSRFVVNRDILIPRPETELLVDEALKSISRKSGQMIKVLEIGTGSGAISISILKEAQSHGGNHKKLMINATDISQNALHTAEQNAQTLLNSAGRSNLILERADILNNKNTTKFDLIISNPPYIPSSEVDLLETSVRDFEPRVALDGGKDGLNLYKKILKLTRNNARDDTTILFEIHEELGGKVINLVKKTYPKSRTRIIKDLNQKSRIIKAQIRQ